MGCGHFSCVCTMLKQARMPAQDFDKLDGILKDYKRFMSECPLIDRTLPTHVNLDGFSNDGLKIHVHVHIAADLALMTPCL